MGRNTKLNKAKPAEWECDSPPVCRQDSISTSLCSSAWRLIQDGKGGLARKPSVGFNKFLSPRSLSSSLSVCLSLYLCYLSPYFSPILYLTSHGLTHPLSCCARVPVRICFIFGVSHSAHDDDVNAQQYRLKLTLKTVQTCKQTVFKQRKQHSKK